MSTLQCSKPALRTPAKPCRRRTATPSKGAATMQSAEIAREVGRLYWPDTSLVGSGGGAVSVRVRCTIRCFRFGAQSGSHAPVSTPCPPNRTCGFPASGSPVGSCLSHNGAPVRSGPSRYRRLCVAPAPRSCTASPAVPLSDLPPRPVTPRRHRAAKPASSAPSLTHVMLRDSLPFQAGIVGKATPAGLRPFVISPHLRPFPRRALPRVFSTTGLSATLPAQPAPRGVPVAACTAPPGLPVLLRFPSSMHAGANTPAETGRCVRRSLPSRSAAFPLLPEGRLPR